MMVELHPKTCLCRGGSWMSFVGQSGSPCARDGRLPEGAVLVPLEQWRAMGKPHDVEEFDSALSNLSHAVVPRQFERYPVAVRIRLRRFESDRPADPFEDTSTENLSRGGARVCSRLEVHKGDILWFEESAGAFRTRAQIQDVSAGQDHERRLHLHFLDGLAPEAMLPPIARL
jgi:hypothetical protein